MSLLRTNQRARKRPRTEEAIAEAKSKKSEKKKVKNEIRNQKLRASKDLADVEEVVEPKKEGNETESVGVVEGALESPVRKVVCDIQAVDIKGASEPSSSLPAGPHEETEAVASVNENETADASLSATMETEIKD